MIVAIHQPHYLPWLRYCDKIARADLFVALDDVEFTRNGWQNRNRVKTAAGPLTLTAPVVHHQKQPIRDVELARGTPWARKHWSTLVQAYARAPFLEEHRAALERIYATGWNLLVDLNLEMLRWHLQALGLQKPVVRSSDLGVPGRATERLVGLVRAVGGTAYLSGRHALGVYLDPRLFEEAGLRLLIHEWTAPEYAQVHPEAGFARDLATLDLVLAEGPRAREVLASGGRVQEFQPA